MEEEEAIFPFSDLFSSLFLSLTILYSIFSYRFFLYYLVLFLFLSFFLYYLVLFLFLSFLSEGDFNVLRE